MPFNIDDLKEFVIRWNKDYPLDFWWRHHFKIPFGSSRHREVDFVDQRIDYEEQKILTQAREEQISGKIIYDDQDVVDFLAEDSDKKIVKMSQKEIEEEFDNLDTAQFEEKEEKEETEELKNTK